MLKMGRQSALRKNLSNPVRYFVLTLSISIINCVFRYVEELKSFHRGKIEIIEINNRDLNESEFLVKVLRRGATWLTAGMHESLQQAFKIAQSVEERQSIIAPAWKRSPTA